MAAGLPLDDLLEINGLRPDEPLRPGQIVYLIDETAHPPPAAAGSGRSNPPASAVVAPGRPLRWPVDEPHVSSLFGKRWGRPHEGLDLAGAVGTPIRAAADGEVAYAGDRIRGYGNMVVIAHPGDLMTVYAHNSVVLVRQGDRVRAGQEIARMGQSGRATAPHLHFEVRKAQSPRDPMPLLPPLATKVGALVSQ